MLSTFVSSQPMSPGLPGGLPSLHCRPPPATIIHPTTFAHTYNTPQPQPPLLPTPPFIANPQPLPGSNRKPLYLSKWSRKTVQNAIENNQAFSVYIENIPLRWTTTDIYLCFAKFGEIIDVFIPAKMTKGGKRFAFLCFRNNSDVNTILHGISSMHVDGVQLSANMATSRNCGNSYQTPFVPPQNRTTVPQYNLATQINPSRSFADTVRSYLLKKINNPAAASQSQQPRKELISSFIPKPSSSSWLQRSAFYTLKSPMPIRDLSDFISSHSSMNCQVVPLGGTSFLVKYDSIEERDMLVHEKPEWVDLLFSIFRPWKFGDVSCDRLCWVLIKGTPPHAWSKDFFQLISTSVGSMVDWSLESKSGERLDVAEVLILTTSIKFINCSFQVTIGDDQFGISIVETQYDPQEWSIPSSELSVPSDASMTLSVPGYLHTLVSYPSWKLVIALLIPRMLWVTILRVPRLLPHCQTHALIRFPQTHLIFALSLKNYPPTWAITCSLNPHSLQNIFLLSCLLSKPTMMLQVRMCQLIPMSPQPNPLKFLWTLPISPLPCQGALNH
ncbi:hypothetical protein Tsubulata_015582 [Turnera subulata]|uniref:RRM domain-containing protein n=1 Tax=Turnera subulata TaxID=218843 RepID=A0A9Q0JA11_9ROSI|nr:hypothetical protein Tsubulata_015582 [Turnera subulata]